MTASKKIVLVGSPNVGKSALFNAFTGASATVSNYPGTTVTLTRGTILIDGLAVEVVDTPGMYSFFSITEEERVARSILLTEEPDVVVNVIDARNIRRMLSLTLQLIEAGLPIILVLNMMDEATAAGVQINRELLARELGIPVVATVATQKSGIDELKKVIIEYGDKCAPCDAVS